MEDELQSKLVEILTSIQKATATATDFTVEQLPDIAQSYVTYGMVTLTLWAVVYALVAACALTISARAAFFSKALDRLGLWTTERFMAVWIGAFVGFVFATFSLARLESAFLVWFAPEVWLLKEIASMVGK